MHPSDFTEQSPGRLVEIDSGKHAFLPAPLPPDLSWDLALVNSLSTADRALGRLAGMGTGELRGINPHLLIRPFTRREAVLSSQIEGTYASMSELVLFEELETTERQAPDVREVFNYVRALEFGLQAIQERSLGVSLLREIHQLLMKDVRGGDRTPGSFRSIQVFLGKSRDIANARYVPPPALEVAPAMRDLESYLQTPGALPPLIRVALVHYQFETIHPFQDGNGRIGRLLITLMLCAEKLLPLPLLYLSAYFEKNRQAYYDRLRDVSLRGDWTGWITFFLEGVREQATDAVDRVGRLMELRSEYRKRFQTARSSSLLLKLIDELFNSPAITAKRAESVLGVTRRSAQETIEKLIADEILREVTGQRRNRVYLAPGIIDATDQPLTSPSEVAPQ